MNPFAIFFAALGGAFLGGGVTVGLAIWLERRWGWMRDDGTDRR